MDNETSLILIQMYAANQLLWDSRHEDYYNKIKREAVWDQIAESMGAPKQELIAKMRSLAGSYRREKNRERKNKARNRPYQSKWYAYQAFSFFRDSKDPLANEDSQDIQNNKCYIDLPGSEDFDEATDENDDDSETRIEPKTQPKGQAPKIKHLKRKLPHAPVNKIANNSAPTPDKLARDSTTDDPYISFGLYIASELRKYDSYTLAHVKHAISNVIFKADTDFFQANNSESVNSTTDKSNTQLLKIEVDNDDDE